MIKTRGQARDDARRAEHIAIGWLTAVAGCRHIIASTRTRFARQDLWGLDCIGFQRADTVIGVQVTSGGLSAQSARRGKLAAIEWPTSWKIYLMAVERKSGRRVEYRYRVQLLGGQWGDWREVSREWWA